MNVVDVCIAATANAIKHNLYIFENLGGQAVIIQQLCREKTTDGIFLKYTCIPKGNHVSDHYDAIVDVELPEHPVCSNSAKIHEEHNEDGDYGEMKDGEMNEKLMKKTKIKEVLIHPYHQEVKIHPYQQPLNIHPYAC